MPGWGNLKYKNLVKEFGSQEGFWKLFDEGVADIEVSQGKLTDPSERVMMRSRSNGRSNSGLKSFRNPLKAVATWQ